MRLEIANLGLAAYMYIMGCIVIEKKGGFFVMESEREVADWEIEYLNSLCYKHDQALLSLKRLKGKD